MILFFIILTSLYAFLLFINFSDKLKCVCVLSGLAFLVVIIESAPLIRILNRLLYFYFEEKKLVYEVPILTEFLVSHLKAGMQPVQAFVCVLKKRKWCITIHNGLSEVIGLFNRGQSFYLALNTVVKNMDQNQSQKYLLILFSTIQIANMSGGNIVQILERVKVKSEDRIKLLRKLKVATAQMRFQALVIILAPFIIGGIIWLIYPENILFFLNNSIGNILLIIMLFLVSIGAYILNKLVKIE